jgi:hypothetical protein
LCHSSGVIESAEQNAKNREDQLNTPLPDAK